MQPEPTDIRRIRTPSRHKLANLATRSAIRSRARNFHISTGLNRGKYCEDSRGESKNFAEVIGGKDDKSQLPTGESLLITKALIGGNHHLVILLRRGNQVAIAEPVPLPFASRGDFVARQPNPQCPRNAMIEEYLHAASEKLV